MDDIEIYSYAWPYHLKRLEGVFCRLAATYLTVNLAKNYSKVIYLGHVVGVGKVTPVEAKIKCVVEYSIPENRKGLVRFLEMAGAVFMKGLILTLVLNLRLLSYLWIKTCYYICLSMRARLIECYLKYLRSVLNMVSM